MTSLTAVATYHGSHNSTLSLSISIGGNMLGLPPTGGTWERVSM